jgi:exportin-2 (importin alpha re-exporter)
LTPDNAKVNNGVLEVAHSIFQRWRPLYRSDELFMEINHVLNQFATPFLNLLLVSSPLSIHENPTNTILME